MKNIYLSLTLLLISLHLGLAQNLSKKQVKKLLPGVWKLQSVEGETLSSEEVNARFTFFKEGGMEMSNDEKQERAQWKISDDAKVFLIMKDGEVEEEMKIKELSKKSFKFEADGKLIILTRVKKSKSANKKLIKQRSKLLIGDWKMTEMEGNPTPEGVEITFFIRSDGSIQASKGGDDQKTGTWKLSEDGEYLQIFEDGQLEESLLITSLSKKELRLSNRGSEASFTRK